jgi:hypothetical protein
MPHMTGEELQIDFQPQPRGIAVVTSVPISSIAESGHYSQFQDLIDGYASSFAKVHVFSPSGDQVVKPLKDHRVSWYSGPKWLSQTPGLWWSVMANRREFRDVELVRTFGPRAGVVGRFISKLSHAPHVSSADDLVNNSWHDKTGLRAIPSKLVNKLGVLSANVLSATLDWELDYLSDSGYNKDLLLGSIGLTTDIYTPVGTTDPDRHPVVLWAGPVTGDDSISLIEEAAYATKNMIDNVEFIVVVLGNEADQLKDHIVERDLPITVAVLEEVEPIVDLIERTWACVTVPGRGLPHGLAMFALSAGVPLISIGELDQRHGFENHLNYIGIDAEPDAVAYALQLLRRWTTWSLRIGISGQKLIEYRYSTRSVGIKEGKQLARIARGEELESSTLPKEAKILRTFVSPSEGEIPELFPKPVAAEVDDEADDAPESEDMYSDPGFDLIAAALSDMSASKEIMPPVAGSDSGSEEMGQDAISALFAAANDEDPEIPSEKPVDLSGGDMDQDAISALFAANDPEPEPAPGTGDSVSGDMDQDAISALFAANDPEPEPAADPGGSVSGDMGQDAISALFAENSPTSESEPIEPEQDFVSALIEAKQDSAQTFTTPDAESEGDLPKVNLVNFDVNDGPTDEPYTDDTDLDDVDGDLIATMLESKNEDPAA